MTSRVDALGVAQPNISTQGGDVVVQIPGVSDPNQVLKTLGSTAQLYFRQVLCGARLLATDQLGRPRAKKVAYKVPPTCQSPYSYTSAYFNASAQAYDPPAADADPAYPRGLPEHADQSRCEVQELERDLRHRADRSASAAPRYVLWPMVDRQRKPR